jgi:hypothetical protein
VPKADGVLRRAAISVIDHGDRAKRAASAPQRDRDPIDMTVAAALGALSLCAGVASSFSVTPAWCLPLNRLVRALPSWPPA